MKGRSKEILTLTKMNWNSSALPAKRLNVDLLA
jgi:hypothetical protein